MSDRRQVLLENNLHDTGVDPSRMSCRDLMKNPHRTAQGQCYFYGIKNSQIDKGDRHMRNKPNVGALNQRFGRNTSKERSNKSLEKDIMHPNPRLISKELFTRIDGKTKLLTY